MAKKFVVRKFNPNKSYHNDINSLINLSSLGIDTEKNIVKSSMALGVSETDAGNVNI